jgi:hypothetical protein
MTKNKTMEKKYRIKEEAKKWFNEELCRQEVKMPFWHNYNVSLEALEEVEEEIKLQKSCNSKWIYKKNEERFSDQEMYLMETVLKNKVFTLDQMIELYNEWYGLPSSSGGFKSWLKEKYD